MRVPAPLGRSLWQASLLGCLVLSTTPAPGKVTTESPYGRAQTFNAALRFIRVDQGFEVFEQDRESGYFLFNYKSDGEVSTGSIEVFEVDDQVKVVVQLPRFPEYHEQVLTNGLHRKLREEYGEPPRRERKEPKDDVVRRPDDRTPEGDGSAETVPKKKKQPKRSGSAGT